MANLFKKDRFVHFSILMILSISLCLIASGKKDSKIDLTSTLISANYICLILNNFYIYCMYSRCKKTKNMYDKTITRIGQKKFFNTYVLNFILDIIVFFIIVTLPILIKHGINSDYIYILITYLALNFINFFIQECISMLIFMTPKGNGFISIPILMNFGFHYLFIQWVLKLIFHF